MQVKSIHRFAKISAFKAREVTRAIQGLPATDAVDLLRFTPKKAAGLILKTLKSAIANAENNNQLNANDLVVKEAVVGEGPTLKRFQPKARGSAGGPATSRSFSRTKSKSPVVMTSLRRRQPTRKPLPRRRLQQLQSRQQHQQKPPPRLRKPRNNHGTKS